MPRGVPPPLPQGEGRDAVGLHGAGPIEDALRRGASAYVLKTVDPTDLPSTLRQVAGGTVFSTIGMTESSTSSGAKAAGLTEREVAILTELAAGVERRDREGAVGDPQTVSST